MLYAYLTEKDFGHSQEKSPSGGDAAISRSYSLLRSPQSLVKTEPPCSGRRVPITTPVSSHVEKAFEAAMAAPKQFGITTPW